MLTQSLDGEVSDVRFALLIHEHYTLQRRRREADGEHVTGMLSLQRRAVDVWSVRVKPLHGPLAKPTWTVVEHMRSWMAHSGKFGRKCRFGACTRSQPFCGRSRFAFAP